MENKKRICPMCKKEKSYTDFYKSKSTLDGCRVYCKKCCAIKKREKYIPSTIRVDLKKEKIKSLESGIKECNQCHEIKELKNFTKRKRNTDGYSKQCNMCIYKKRQERIKKYEKKRKNIILIDKTCKKCGIKKTIENFNIRKDIRDGYDNVCRECRKIYSQNYYNENSKVLIEKKTNYIQHKRENDLPYILKIRTRNLFRIRLSQMNCIKEESFFKYTGICLDEYINHLKKDPLWKNYINNENIHLDHIIPMSIYDFKNKEDIKKCWNPLNLRLLFAEDNIFKSNKIQIDLIKKHNIEHLLPDKYEIKKGE